jgi:hypothetical protein
MKKNSLILIVLLALATFSACKKGGGDTPEPEPTKTPVGTNDGTAATKTIGSAGGSLMSADGEVELIIPSGALATNTDITIQPITNNIPTGRGKAYRFTPDGQQFAKDITIKFHYTEEEAEGTKPEYMQVAFQNADGTWKVVDKVTNDEAANTINASVNHFTDFSQFDIMRLIPASAYLKTGQTENFEISYVGMSGDNMVTFGLQLLREPAVWKANGVTNGNSEHGTIQSTAPVRATYTAPATAPAINPVVISAEINIPFTVDGQRFNKGVLTGNAFIIGGKYSVLIESSADIGIGTGEKFRVNDNVSFTVNLVGVQATITNIQNTVATIQKVQNSPVDCNTVVTSVGTGGIHLLDGDISVLVNPLDKVVYISINQTGNIVHPKATTTCGTNTPGNIELLAANGTGSGWEFIDNGLLQTKSETTTIHTLKYTFTPLP